MTTKGILGKKVGMTQVFTENGELVPVTVVEVGTNVVLQVKTVENDGYNAIQLGFDDQRAVNVNKPDKGHADKAKTAPKRFVREIRDVQGDYKVGDEVKVKVIGKKDGKISLSMKAALDADAEVVDNREPAFNYKEEGQAATSLASLLAGIKLD